MQVSNWRFDAKDYNPDGHFSPLEPGDYRVRIKEAEETTSKAGDPMIKLTLEVSGKKSKLWYYLVFPTNGNDPKFLQRKAMTNQKLGEIWESFKLKVGDMNLLDWTGKVGAARVKQEMNEMRGELQNSVSYFLTQKRQESLNPWQEPDSGGNEPKSLRDELPNDGADQNGKPWEAWK